MATTETSLVCQDCGAPLSKNQLKLGHTRCQPCYDSFAKSFQAREDERWRVWWRISERKMGLR